MEACCHQKSFNSNNEFLPLAPKKVKKRDNSEVAFDLGKIVLAIKNAGNETGEFNEDIARELAADVEKVIRFKFNGEIPNIENIQDIVEFTLARSGFFKTAKAYIVYRENREKIRHVNNSYVDAVESIREYLSRADWRVRANANQGYSLGGLILNSSGKLIANYWLDQIYPKFISDAHRNADFHIHDLDMLSGYCAGWSLRSLLREGFNGVANKVEANPPKHLSSALGQMVNFLGTLQNEWAGAQAFSSFDTYLAPYIRLDNLSYKQVRQDIQEFIYNLNVPSRWGMQTPFTNLTFDWCCPDGLKEQKPIVGGIETDFCYGDLQKEMDMINKAFIEVMSEGDAKGRIFTFPIPTYNITNDFPWDSEIAQSLFEMTAKYGTPYFQNFVNSDLSPEMVRSMCCRLRLDLRELLKRGNGLFGSAEQTGSIGVVTINCARLGFVHRGDKESLYERLEQLIGYAKTSLEIKRKEVQRYMDLGLYPFTKRYLGTLRNHFSTIGINGVNEMIRNFYNDEENITTEKGYAMAVELMDFIRSLLVKIQEETGHMYNLEATPAEGTTYRFAKEDAKRYPGIVQAGTKRAPYYTNSTQLPAGYTHDAFDALKVQDNLQIRYTGGTVFHLYMNERISGAKVCGMIVKKVVENFRLPYFTITPTFSICPNHGYLPGEHEYCPKCDDALRQKYEYLQRVNGTED